MADLNFSFGGRVATAAPSDAAPILLKVTSLVDLELRVPRRHRRPAGSVDRSERGKLALTGPSAKEFLQGQVSNDVEALTPGTGCYAAFLTPKGKMLGDLRILDTGDELLLDTERVALQELFNMIRRFSVGYDVQLHKRTLQQGLLSLLGPDGRRGRRRQRPAPSRARPPRPARSAASPSARSAPMSASTCSATPGDTDALAAALAAARRRAGLRGGRRLRCASSAAVPATASTSTTR